MCEQYEPNSGYYYLRARYMDPNTGRFVSVDPWKADPQAPISLHKYLYSEASPISKTDPTGYGVMMSLAEFNVVQSIQNTLRSIQSLVIRSQFLSVQDHIYFTLAAASIAQAFLFPQSQSVGISLWKTYNLYNLTNHKYPDVEVELKFDAGNPVWFRLKVKANATGIFKYDLVSKKTNVNGEVPFNIYETPLVKIEAILALRLNQHDLALGFNFQMKKPFTLTTRTARMPLWVF